MPFHLPHLGHHSHDKHKAKSGSSLDDHPAYAPVTQDRRKSSGISEHKSHPQSPTSPVLGLRTTTSPDVEPQRPELGQERSSSTSGSQLQGILKSARSPSVSNSEYTNSSGTGSAFANMHKRMSSLAFDRSDTIDSVSTMDDDRRHNVSSPSTPGTSVSSFSAHCPLPTTAPDQRFPFFMMTLSSVSTLSFIALPPPMRTIVLDAINRAWKKGTSKIAQVDYQAELMRRHKDKGCDGGVWEVTMKGEAWMPTSSEQVSSKRILVNLMIEFAREGYNLTSSFRTSAKDSGKDTLIFLRGEPDPDPVFFAVAFYSHDRIWIIDAEADVGESLEEGIKNWWVDGIRDARVRERHCREIRLRGAPWTAHSSTSLISARCIHLTIMKIVTHCQTGYDFVGSVDMADREEGEMPVTFYRKKWGAARAVWHVPGAGLSDHLAIPPRRSDTDDASSVLSA
ncbi:hypothetical protein IAU60_002709 [Kwoniella sp. DSM 27419]